MSNGDRAMTKTKLLKKQKTVNFIAICIEMVVNNKDLPPTEENLST